MASKRIDEKSRGVFVISATPFTETGELDFASTDRLMDFYLSSGVTGVTVLGVMGEAQKLNADESLAFVERVLHRVGGKVPVLVGVTNPGIDNLIGLAKRSMDGGAGGIMLQPLAGSKTDEDVFGYFDQVFSRLDHGTPVCIQDYPPTSNVYMSVGLLNRLTRAFPSYVMLKMEDCPGLKKLSKLRKTESDAGRRMSVFVGNGGLYLPQEMARGADGVMTGFAFPEMLVEVVRRFAEGDGVGAEDLYDCYLPLVRHEQQPGFGLGVRKEILFRRGAIASPAVRAPGPKLDRDDIAELERLLQRLEAKLAAQTGRESTNAKA